MNAYFMVVLWYWVLVWYSQEYHRNGNCFCLSIVVLVMKDLIRKSTFDNFNNQFWFSGMEI